MRTSIDTKRTHPPSGRLLAIAVTAAIGLAACGAATTPQVASLGTSTAAGNGNSTSTLSTGSASASGRPARKPAKGNPTALVDDWATCMHSHGDPNQVDPTIDASGGINITVAVNAQALSQAIHGGADPCNQYIAAAQRALRAAHPTAPPPDQAALVKYVSCMRADGVPKYPYPVGNQTDFNGTGVDPNSPFVENANKVCGKQIGAPAWWISGTGPPGDVSVGSGPGGGPIPNGGQRPVQGANGGPAAQAPVVAGAGG